MFSLPLIRLPRNGAVLCAFAFLLAGTTAVAQVTYDAQIPFSFSGLTLASPRGVAVAPDGTVYVADIQSSTSGRVVRITPSGQVSGNSGTSAVLSSTVATLAPASITLKNPTAVVVDSAGNLYIADAGGHQVVKMTAPETSNAATLIAYGGTETPTALAVDSSNNLYIADATQHAIFKVVGGVATQLSISPSNLNPVGLAVDAAGNVYFADALNNAIYKYSGGSTQSFLTTSSAGSFHFSSASGTPIGMGFDPAGNLYVLDSSGDHLFEVNTPATTNYQVPYASISTPGSLAVSAAGNLYITDDTNRAVDELFYNNNPVNFGSISAGKSSARVNVNFYFNSSINSPKLYESMQGDNSGEIVSTSANANACSGASNCTLTFYVNYQTSTPGLRNGVFGISDNAKEIFAVPSIGIGLAGGLALYPGIQATVENSASSPLLYEPQGLAISGDGGTLFVADEGGILSANPQTYVNGNIYAYPTGGGSPSLVGGYGGQFQTPMALALDPAGNLYVADYNGTLSVVAPTPPTGFQTAATWNTSPKQVTLPGGVTLDHPMSLAFDPSGNLYIGDMGPAGTAATASSPGYIVKVPANGGPAVKLHYTVSGSPVVFPQALATDSAGNLYIGDGGDGQDDMGGVDVVPVATGTPVALPFTGTYALSSPSGLGFDAANDLYVLDGFNQRILVAPVTYTNGIPSVAGSSIGFLGEGDSGIQSVLVTPSNMVVWPGGQNITVTDIGFQPTTGQATPAQVITLQAQNASVDASYGSASVSGVDVGNMPVTFTTPGQTGANDFSLSGCGTAGSQVTLGVGNTCTSTINYTGDSSQSATFTLKSTLALSNTTLGNQIFVTTEPQLPTGKLTASNPVNQIITVTLTNVGLQQLNVQGVAIGAGATGMLITGGTCSAGARLQQGQSCTVLVTMSGILSYGNVVITDNNNGVPGTQQSIFLWDLFGFGGLVAPVGGGGILGGTTPLTRPDSGQNSTGVPGAALGTSGGASTFTTQQTTTTTTGIHSTHVTTTTAIKPTR